MAQSPITIEIVVSTNKCSEDVVANPFELLSSGHLESNSFATWLEDIGPLRDSNDLGLLLSLQGYPTLSGEVFSSLDQDETTWGGNIGYVSKRASAQNDLAELSASGRLQHNPAIDRHVVTRFKTSFKMVP